MTTDRYTFSVVLTPEEVGGYTVSVPLLPEAITHGTTIDEALAHAQECIELCVENRIRENKDVPQQRSAIATGIITIEPRILA